MSYWSFLKQVLNGIIGVINATAVSDVWSQIKQPLLQCDPQRADLCEAQVVRESLALAIGAAWLDYALRWLPQVVSQRQWSEAIPVVWAMFTDMMGSWSFYLLSAAAVMNTPENTFEQMSNDEAFFGAVTGTLALAFFSNAKLRQKIRAFFYAQTARGGVVKVIDALFETCHGFAQGGGFMLTLGSIYDSYQKTTQGTSSLAAQGILYAWASFWGVLAGVMGYRYGPNLMVADLFSDEIIRTRLHKASILFNGLFSAATFTLLMGDNMRRSVAPWREMAVAAVALLVPALFLQVGIKEYKKNRLLMTLPIEAKASDSPILTVPEPDDALWPLSDNRPPVRGADALATLGYGGGDLPQLNVYVRLSAGPLTP